MTWYKGYVITKDKKPVGAIKSNMKKLEQVQNHNEYAGVLKEDSVLIDVDDEHQSKILFQIVQDLALHCQVLKSTRGMHFLFKNTDMIQKSFTHQNLAIGLNTDCKCGKSTCYEVLRMNGKNREILYDVQPYDEIPKWLKPVRKKLQFLTMSAGDGRNQELFNYILTLQSSGYTVDETRETIRLLNKYVLPEPLDDSELEVILRDEAFQKPVFYDGTTFLFDKFAMFLKNHHYIKRIDGSLHIYKDGIYVADYQEIEACMIQHIPFLNRAKRQEVLAYLELLIRDNEQPAPPNFIAFRNGIYDLENDIFSGFSPDIVITNKIPWDYNIDAQCDAVDTVLNNISCNDEEIRMLLEEMVGACMYRSNHLAGGKAFILTGVGSNGKSTFLDLLKKMLGYENVSVLDIKRLDDRFSTIMMQNKLANIGDDLSEDMVFDDSTFKKIVTGQSLDAEHKGQNKTNFTPYCKLIFSANTIPRIGKGKDSNAIMRRLIIVPFNAKFTYGDPTFNPNIGEQLSTSEAMEYLIQLGLDALYEVVINKMYTNSTKVETELKDYERQNHPLLQFIEYCEFEDYPILGEQTRTVYDRYKEFCVMENLQPVASNWFSKDIKKTLGYGVVDRKINGKKCRVFSA